MSRGILVATREYKRDAFFVVGVVGVVVFN